MYCDFEKENGQLLGAISCTVPQSRRRQPCPILTGPRVDESDHFYFPSMRYLPTAVTEWWSAKAPHEDETLFYWCREILDLVERGEIEQLEQKFRQMTSKLTFLPLSDESPPGTAFKTNHLNILGKALISVAFPLLIGQVDFIASISSYGCT